MGKKIISLDGTILNSIQSCSQKTDYSFGLNLQPPEKAESLEKGDLLHKMAEVYFGLVGNCARFDSPVWVELIEQGFASETGLKTYQIPTKSKKDEIIDLSISIGRYYASKMNLPLDEVDLVISNWKAYCEFYEHDPWNPLAVEEVGCRPLHEDEDFQIIYNFKVDRICEKGNIVAPFDIKTSSRRSTTNSLSNQFIGYCFGLGLNTIVIDKVGFQKTLSASEKFTRDILTIDAERIEEWRVNAIITLAQHFIVKSEEDSEALDWLRLLRSFKTRTVKNFTSCDKYSGCIFSSLCEAIPTVREYRIERDFKVGESWDVAHILEAK